MWPQIVIMFLEVFGLGISLAMHGKPKTGKHNFLVSLVMTSISIWILYKGGFFNNI